MVIKNKKYNSGKAVLLFILITTLNLAFLYFIKYQNQRLTLSDFNLFTIGNLINLVLFIIFILGVLIIFYDKNLQFEFKYLIPIFIANQVILVSVYLATKVALPFDEFYYLSQNGNRLFIGALFTIYQFTFLTLIIFIWNIVYRVTNLLFIRSLLSAGWAMLFFLILAFVFIVAKENSFEELEIKFSDNNSAVVLGAAVWSKNKPSPTLAARIDKALELYSKNKISAIYLTGGNAPGELAESEVALNYIKTKSKDLKNVYNETQTKSTNEQIQYIKSRLLNQNNQKNIIVISDSYHLVRIIEISNFHNIKIQVVPSELPLSLETALYFKIREALALVVFWFFAY
jgi:vancomycin permeability regulator SanA